MSHEIRWLDASDGPVLEEFRCAIQNSWSRDAEKVIRQTGKALSSGSSAHLEGVESILVGVEDTGADRRLCAVAICVLQPTPEDPNGDERALGVLALGVEVAYQNQGIGYQLKEFIVDYARGQEDISVVWSKVHDGNHPMRNINAKLGFGSRQSTANKMRYESLFV